MDNPLQLHSSQPLEPEDGGVFRAITDTQRLDWLGQIDKDRIELWPDNGDKWGFGYSNIVTSDDIRQAIDAAMREDGDVA